MRRPYGAAPGVVAEEIRRAGRRGTTRARLGVIIGIEVSNVDATADHCRSAGCTVTTVPVDAPWGERYAECLDLYGYAWKFFQLLPDPQTV
ncbi:VOC family protein [Streptomyces mirabilis]